MSRRCRLRSSAPTATTPPAPAPASPRLSSHPLSSYSLTKPSYSTHDDRHHCRPTRPALLPRARPRACARAQGRAPLQRRRGAGRGDPGEVQLRRLRLQDHDLEREMQDVHRRQPCMMARRLISTNPKKSFE